MKMVVAIMNSDDSYITQGELSNAGFQVTLLATTGGFLMKGNSTLIIGVEDEKVEDVLKIVKSGGHRRKQLVPALPIHGSDAFSAQPLEVTVGGATVFVLDVEQFEKY